MRGVLLGSAPPPISEARCVRPLPTGMSLLGAFEPQRRPGSTVRSPLISASLPNTTNNLFSGKS